MEQEMATHSSILAWRISWTEEIGRLQSMGSHRVGHDWVIKQETENRAVNSTPRHTSWGWGRGVVVQVLESSAGKLVTEAEGSLEPIPYLIPGTR